MQLSIGSTNEIIDNFIKNEEKIYLVGPLTYTNNIKDLDETAQEFARSVAESYINPIYQQSVTPFAVIPGGETPDEYHLSGVVKIKQTQAGVRNGGTFACGPTVGAMITQYWYYKGYNVRGTTYYGSQPNLINHLHDDMSTGLNGTTMTNFRYGLENHLQETGLSWYVSPEYPSDSTQFNHDLFKSVIHQNIPIALRFNNMTSIDGVLFKWHFVLAKGYDTKSSNGNVDFIYVKDPAGDYYGDVHVNHELNQPYFSWSYHHPY